MAIYKYQDETFRYGTVEFEMDDVELEGDVKDFSGLSTGIRMSLDKRYEAYLVRKKNNGIWYVYLNKGDSKVTNNAENGIRLICNSLLKEKVADPEQLVKNEMKNIVNRLTQQEETTDESNT